MKSFLSYLVEDRYGLIGLLIVVFVALLSALAPYLPMPDPNSIEFKRFQPPSQTNIFGTDNLGGDVASRVIWGGRTSLMIGLGSAGIAAFLGSLLGSLAGLCGGLADVVISRVIEVFLLLPTFFLAIIVAAVFSGNIINLMLVIGVTTWPTTARVMRGHVLSIKERLFVEASKALGAGTLRLLFKHILPNSLAPLISYTTLLVGRAILIEAGLSYLGLGDPNMPSWGRMIYRGQTFIFSAWWIAFFPGLFLTLAVLGWNLLGDSLLRYFNPRLRYSRHIAKGFKA